MGAMVAPHILNAGNNSLIDPLTGKRFVTLCIPIHTSTWELSGDFEVPHRLEYEHHTLENTKLLRESFAKNNPDGRLTWAYSLKAFGRK